MEPDNFVACSFRLHKKEVMAMVGSVQQSLQTCTLMSERIASALIKKKMFLASAYYERELIMKAFGAARYTSFMSYTRRQLFTFIISVVLRRREYQTL